MCTLVWSHAICSCTAAVTRARRRLPQPEQVAEELATGDSGVSGTAEWKALKDHVPEIEKL